MKSGGDWMKKNNKRGQAAMEFLTTYGWAILVIVIVLAALLWMGVFNVMNKVPERCEFQPGIGCSSILFAKRLPTDPGGERVVISSLFLTNNLPEAITVCGTQCSTFTELSSYYSYLMVSSDCFNSPYAVRIGMGQKKDIVPIWSTNPSDNNKYGHTCWTGSAESPVLLTAEVGSSVNVNLLIWYVKAGDTSTLTPPRISRGTAVAVVQGRYG